jgi:putative heme-binding domain-containing protein
MPRFLSAILLAAVAAGFASAQPKPAPKPITATPVDQLKVAKGFKVELLYSVPKEEQGSWVNMTDLPDGRLVVSDQYEKGLFLVAPANGIDPAKTSVKPMNLTYKGKPFGMAQGLCWAFDALYVVVNGNGSGLYKVTASKKGGDLDTVELLREFEAGAGEHGPHAVIKHPDGKRLTVVCGNQTKMVKYDTTKVPPHWGEDHLLPRLPDGKGFMASVLGPGGCIYNVTPDGKTWELFSVGFRNQFDAAYSPAGDLFTYDADMEYDFNTPWYRPTRICQVTSGSEFGWRNGAGKYPAFYADSLPGICDIGPGSPTGVCFGTGAKFPAKYQKTLFACDWSYGKLYAVHLAPNGSVQKGTAEEFISGTPLPLTDIVVNRKDGAMYFTIGGRKTQSGLYRVTYEGKESTATASDKLEPAGKDEKPGQRGPTLAEQRWGWEQYHGRAVEKIFRESLVRDLGSDDRFVRFAARVALEHQAPKLVSELAFSAEGFPQAVITAMLALTRIGADDPLHAKPNSPKADPGLRGKILASLGKLDFAKLTVEQRLELIRVYHILFNRFGMPTDAERSAWLAKYEPTFPTGNRLVDGELLQVFVYLQGEKAAAKGVKLLQEGATQEEQLEYARALRMLKAGWTPESRKGYFEWFVKAQTYKGGASFGRFVEMMKEDAVKTLSAEEKVALKPILEAKAEATNLVVLKPRPFVKKYALDELVPLVEKGLKAGGRDFDGGRKMFAATSCFACHRYDNEGGAAGPDLTAIAGRFSQKDLLESIVDPSKEVSDQYAAVEIDTLDGKKIVGRIVNLNGDNIMVNTDMLNPNGQVTVSRKNIDLMKPSKLSMMPAGLLDTLKEEEILDLMAYLLSRGDRKHAMFGKK